MIGLITPTGGRKEQIQMLSVFMQKQDYNKQVLWVIVDDCEPITCNFIDEKNFKPKWQIVKLFPSPIWQEGQNTQSRNLLKGIREVEKYDLEAVFIIEDDDYYPPNYLSEMMKRLWGFDLAGEINSVYYNIKEKGWAVCGNTKHASLFQIAIKPLLLPLLKKICLQNEKMLDVRFCKQVRHKNLFKDTPMAIGIKGLKGRSGIGIGHTKKNYNLDQTGKKLKELIGKDSAYYI